MPATLERSAQTADITFRMADVEPDVLKVTALSGTEGLSELFRFQLDLVSRDRDLDFSTLIGKACSIEIATPEGSRYINGMVRRFARAAEGTSLTHYVVEVVPRHWMLTQRHDARIFQAHNCPDMTPIGIVKKVLEDAGIPADAYRVATTETYDPPRDFVVQYRESDFDFISRLMEEEGIFYFFEHTATGHKMVFGDSKVAHVASPLAAKTPFRAPSGLVPEDDCVFGVFDQQEIRFGATRLDDFKFEDPKLDLAGNAAAGQFSSLEFYDYPGGYLEKSQAERYARLRLEELQCARRWIRMAASERGLLPGYKFSLEEHPAESLNGEYLVVRCTHHARLPESGEEDREGEATQRYTVDLEVIPATVPYRPARRTPRPVVRGSQTALVVGPKGEEIYTDKYGRVKVQFHWDRVGKYDENSSCWIRVSQGWAGGKYGMMFLPRVGHEVIVDFLEGDPNRPIITGRVYNGDLTPVWDLPERKYRSGIKSQSTKGGDGASALVFHDLKGEEYVKLHSERDMELTCENDLAQHTAGDVDIVIDKSRFELIKKYHQSEVRLDHDEKIGGNKSQSVGGSVAEDFGGAHSESCAKYYLKTSSGEAVIEGATGITLKVGGSFVRIHSGGVDIVGPKINLNSGGSAGTGSSASAGEFDEVFEAGWVKHGYDVTYSAAATAPSGGSEMTDEVSEPPEEQEKITSWIEIEMVDEAGQPWPNEKYEVKSSTGKIYKGSLDQQGKAHVPVDKPGMCTIRFPNLDAAAWERI